MGRKLRKCKHCKKEYKNEASLKKHVEFCLMNPGRACKSCDPEGLRAKPYAAAVKKIKKLAEKDTLHVEAYNAAYEMLNCAECVGAAFAQSGISLHHSTPTLARGVAKKEAKLDAKVKNKKSSKKVKKTKKRTVKKETTYIVEDTGIAYTPSEITMKTPQDVGDIVGLDPTKEPWKYLSQRMLVINRNDRLTLIPVAKIKRLAYVAHKNNIIKGNGVMYVYLGDKEMIDINIKSVDEFTEILEALYGDHKDKVYFID